ncbi:MAG: glycosyltransferase family 2 protein [Verrucomicrobiota bacterium]|nr:glycosyltransferase family 2 protein [Verrucomicrobiota bacterium]
MLISVAIPFYNNSETLSVAIRSALNQIFEDFELILLDDGSSDGSLQIARGFKDERIHILSDGKNLGLPARLNQSVQIARGKYYARMDADDISYPERLAQQANFLETNPSVDLIGCGAVVFDHYGKGIGTFPIHLTHEQIVSRPRSGFYLPHPTWMGKTEWFRKYPYNTTSLKAQDQELLLRTYRTSRFGSINQILFGYHQENMTFSKALRGRFYFSRALWQDALKHKQIFKGGMAIASQFCKIIFDFITLKCGLDLPTTHRRRSITAEQSAKWDKIWASFKE